VLAACDGEPKFKSTDITGAPYGKTLALNDHTGRARSLADYYGKVVVLFFGFTHCPDICPTTLGDTKLALQKLGSDAQRVQVLFITLDPERDTKEVLARYVTAFDPKFVGLYGDLAATQSAAKEFKVFFEKRAGSTPGEYSVDHSAQSYVIDAGGRLRLFVRHSRINEDLAADLRVLLNEQR
jgi:protein SCO1